MCIEGGHTYSCSLIRHWRYAGRVVPGIHPRHTNSCVLRHRWHREVLHSSRSGFINASFPPAYPYILNNQSCGHVHYLRSGDASVPPLAPWCFQRWVAAFTNATEKSGGGMDEESPPSDDTLEGITEDVFLVRNFTYVHDSKFPGCAGVITISETAAN